MNMIFSIETCDSKNNENALPNRRDGTYLRNFIMRAVTSWADLIIWSLKQLPLHLKTPDRLHPGIFFPIHQTDGHIAHLTPLDSNKLKSSTCGIFMEYLYKYELFCYLPRQSFAER